MPCVRWNKEAEDVVVKTKQEFERFAERAVLDVTRKDQAIQSMNEGGKHDDNSTKQ